LSGLTNLARGLVADVAPEPSGGEIAVTVIVAVAVAAAIAVFVVLRMKKKK